MDRATTNGGFPLPPDGEPVRLRGVASRRLRRRHPRAPAASRSLARRAPGRLRPLRRAVRARCVVEDAELPAAPRLPRSALVARALSWPERLSWRWLSLPVAAVAVLGILVRGPGAAASDDRRPRPRPRDPPPTTRPSRPAADKAARSPEDARLISESTFQLALPAGWERDAPSGGATFAAVAPGGDADAMLWIERDPKLDFATFEARSLAQLESLAGSAGVGRAQPGPDAGDDHERARADLGARRARPTTRSCSAAAPATTGTTSRPPASPAPAPRRSTGVELIQGSFLPQGGGALMPQAPRHRPDPAGAGRAQPSRSAARSAPSGPQTLSVSRLARRLRPGGGGDRLPDRHELERARGRRLLHRQRHPAGRLGRRPRPERRARHARSSSPTSGPGTLLRPGRRVGHPARRGRARGPRAREGRSRPTDSARPGRAGLQARRAAGRRTTAATDRGRRRGRADRRRPVAATVRGEEPPVCEEPDPPDEDEPARDRPPRHRPTSPPVPEDDVEPDARAGRSARLPLIAGGTIRRDADGHRRSALRARPGVPRADARQAPDRRRVGRARGRARRSPPSTPPPATRSARSAQAGADDVARAVAAAQARARRRRCAR